MADVVVDPFVFVFVCATRYAINRTLTSASGVVAEPRNHAASILAELGETT